MPTKTPTIKQYHGNQSINFVHVAKFHGNGLDIRCPYQPDINHLTLKEIQNLLEWTNNIQGTLNTKPHGAYIWY